MTRLLIGHSLRRYFDRWAFVRHVLWAVEALVLSGLSLMFRLLPTDRASAVGRRLFMWFGPKQPKHNKFRKNFELAFPYKSKEEIDRLATVAWGNLGSVFAEYPHLKTICEPGAHERLEVVIKEDFKALRDNTKPAIFVSGHLANWEIAAAAIIRLGIPMTTTYIPRPNPWFNRMLYRWRQELGCKLVQQGDSVRPFIKELIEGRSIGLVIDQRVDGGTMLPLFGMDKYTTLIPAKLALRHGCELIPVRSERLTGARFRATFYPPVTPDNQALDDIDKAKQMTRKVNRLLETWIGERPEDWFCPKRIWPKGVQPLHPPGGCSESKSRT